MFNNVALDVFIGLVFIFLLYSLLATIIQEMIATRLAFRAKVLEKAILRMLEDGKTTTSMPYIDRINGVLHLLGLNNVLKGKNVAPWFYAHPLIKYLAEDNYYSKPAYLDASNFSKVMIDLLKGFGQPESQAIQSIHNSIAAGIIHKLPINISTVAADKANPAIKILRDQNPSLPDKNTLASETVALNINTSLFLRSLWQDSGADLNIFKAKLEEWFNDTMERATGWYKRYTRIVLFIIGLVVAYVFNVDTIAIHRILSTNKAAREELVQMAISNKDNLDPKKILYGDSTNPKSDSLLNATYKMVASDAAKANDILGLGRPWKDTCKMCHDSLTCGNFKNRLASLQKINSILKDSINALSASLTNNKKILDSINNNLDSLRNIKSKDTSIVKNTALKLDKIIKVDSILLRKRQGYQLPEYERMLSLENRCEYIKNKRKGKWNLYSPNQSGGWETFFGWLITALAITLGAPFWFDLLSKLISLRGAGNKITPTDDDGSNKTNPSVSSSTNPVNVNVNSNPGEEAVG